MNAFDPGTGRIRKIAVGESPTGVAYGEGEVWVAAGRSGNVLRNNCIAGGVRDSRGASVPCGIHLRPFREDSWYNRSASHALRLLRE